MRAFRVTVPEPDEDLATALLWEAGTAGIEVGAATAGRTALLAYFPDDVSFAGLKQALAHATIEAAPTEPKRRVVAGLIIVPVGSCTP